MISGPVINFIPGAYSSASTFPDQIKKPAASNSEVVRTKESLSGVSIWLSQPIEKIALSYTQALAGQTHKVVYDLPRQARKTTQRALEGQLLVEAMQTKGLLSNTDITETEQTEFEASLPPYGSDEEAKLFEELADVLSEAFQAAGTTIADEIMAERDE